jgi:hypothetical protein
MTLRELMLLARGPKIGAELREAEIARLPADRSNGRLATTIRVPLDSTYLLGRDSTGRYIGPPGTAFPATGSAGEVMLEPYDNVLIFAQPEFELQRMVMITGEVLYPGTYALRSKDEKLVDLIQRAGGLTKRAYPEGIRFERAVAGRINIDLRRALRDKESPDNIILQPEDQVTIPEYQASVKITGAVNSPGSVLYREVADKGAVSVRFANGEVRTRSRTLFFVSNPTPRPGSEVFVPSKDPNEPTVNKADLFAAIAQVLSSMVAIIVVATR